MIWYVQRIEKKSNFSIFEGIIFTDTFKRKKQPPLPRPQNAFPSAALNLQPYTFTVRSTKLGSLCVLVVTRVVHQVERLSVNYSESVYSSNS